MNLICAIFYASIVRSAARGSSSSLGIDRARGRPLAAATRKLVDHRNARAYRTNKSPASNGGFEMQVATSGTLTAKLPQPSSTHSLPLMFTQAVSAAGYRRRSRRFPQSAFRGRRRRRVRATCTCAMRSLNRRDTAPPLALIVLSGGPSIITATTMRGSDTVQATKEAPTPHYWPFCLYAVPVFPATRTGMRAPSRAFGPTHFQILRIAPRWWAIAPPSCRRPAL